MLQKKFKKRISIVKKSNLSFPYWQSLGLILHNHLNSRLHLCWSIKTGTPYYRDCIERSFVREKDWLCLCNRLKISGVVGLAECLVRGIRYEGVLRVERCVYLEKAIRGKRTVWIKYCREYLKAKHICLCPVSSSSVKFACCTGIYRV
jgi:hypothetical protein